jgi:hypothetical protein
MRESAVRKGGRRRGKPERFVGRTGKLSGKGTASRPHSEKPGQGTEGARRDRVPNLSGHETEEDDEVFLSSSFLLSREDGDAKEDPT